MMNEQTNANRKGYKAYLDNCRELWVGAISYADWLLEGCPATNEAYVNGVYARAGWTRQTQKTVILDDGYTATVAVEPKAAVKSSGLLRLPEMFRQGKIATGDVLTVVKHPDASAAVVDGNTVMFDNGDKKIPMSYNEFAQRVTGHKAVNVYIWIEANGKLLNDLR